MGIGDVFGLLGHLSPEEILTSVLHHAEPAAAHAVFRELFLHHMNAEARVKLGTELSNAGAALVAGHVDDASAALGEVVGNIKF